MKSPISTAVFVSLALTGAAEAARELQSGSIAFASAATTGFRRDHGEVTPASLALDACIAAIRDAGIPAEEINGLVGANPEYIQASLGIPHLTYWNGPGVPFVSAVANAMNAIANWAEKWMELSLAAEKPSDKPADARKRA